MDHQDMDRLLERLRALPVPPPSADYGRRVLGAVRRAEVRSYAPALGAALAASLALGIGLSVQLGSAPDTKPRSEPKTVTLAAGAVSPVRLMFRSPRALEGVTIQLQLPAGVELAGHPGRSELTWQTDLQAGANLLELPMIAQGGEGGLLTASLGHGQDRRQFAVLVKVNKEV
jgi:hypothetical protein